MVAPWLCPASRTLNRNPSNGSGPAVSHSWESYADCRRPGCKQVHSNLPRWRPCHHRITWRSGQIHMPAWRRPDAVSRDDPADTLRPRLTLLAPIHFACTSSRLFTCAIATWDSKPLLSPGQGPGRRWIARLRNTAAGSTWSP